MDLAHRLKDLTAPTGEEELLNIKYPTPRLRITPRHGMIILICALVLCAGFFAAYLHKDPPVPHSNTLAALPTTLPNTATPTSGDIVVAVIGAVAHPGLVTLTPGARAADALTSAQPLPEAELIGINLAQKLNDGVQIAVPATGQAIMPAPPAGGGAPGKLSLNQATAADLIALPGVGDKTAQTIIAHRDKIGGFNSVEQLKEIKGIGPAKFAELEKLVTP